MEGSGGLGRCLYPAFITRSSAVFTGVYRAFTLIQQCVKESPWSQDRRDTGEVSVDKTKKMLLPYTCSSGIGSCKKKVNATSVDMLVKRFHACMISGESAYVRDFPLQMCGSLKKRATVPA